MVPPRSVEPEPSRVIVLPAGTRLALTLSTGVGRNCEDRQAPTSHMKLLSKTFQWLSR